MIANSERIVGNQGLGAGFIQRSGERAGESFQRLVNYFALKTQIFGRHSLDSANDRVEWFLLKQIGSPKGATSQFCTIQFDVKPRDIEVEERLNFEIS